MCRVFAAVVIAATASACSAEPQRRYTTPGALYVAFWGTAASADDAPTETVEIRNGHVVAHHPVRYAVARDRPDRSSSSLEVSMCARGYSLSPDGVHALCYSESDRELRLVDAVHRRIQNVVVRNIEDNANAFAWMDSNRIVATVADKTCPLASLYEYFPTRVETFALNGRRLSVGPCAFGVVAGRHRLAMIGEAPNSLTQRVEQIFADDPNYYNDGYDRVHHTWSVDGGKTWHDGMPLAFDGNDALLYREAFSDTVRSENGAVVLKNAYSVEWSR